MTKHKLVKIIFSIFIFFVVLFPLSVGAAEAAKNASEGLNQTANQGYLGTAGTEAPTEDKLLVSIPVAIGKVVGAGLAFIGIVFLLLMIYGGFTWMMARGNEQEVETAKVILQSAVIGLIIVLAAYAITSYIGSQLL